MPSFSSRGGGGPFGSDSILIYWCPGLLLQQLPAVVNSLAAVKDVGGNRSAGNLTYFLAWRGAGCYQQLLL